MPEHSSGQVDSGLAVTVFFGQSALHTASVLLVLGNSTLVTPIQVLDGLQQLEQ